MNTKHTPGPWAHTFTSTKESGVRTAAGFICFLTKPSHYAGQDERYERELNENKSNAKLIAAAPDLLEALQILIGDIDKSPVRYTRDEKIKVAKAAIKKATE